MGHSCVSELLGHVAGAKAQAVTNQVSERGMCGAGELTRRIRCYLTFVSQKSLNTAGFTWYSLFCASPLGRWLPPLFNSCFFLSLHHMPCAVLGSCVLVFSRFSVSMKNQSFLTDFSFLSFHLLESVSQVLLKCRAWC